MKKTSPIIICFLINILFTDAQTLFGVTSAGKNVQPGGTIYKFAAATKNIAVLKSFEGVPAYPDYNSFVQAGDGKLYGMTSRGGNYECGVIFSLDPASGAFKKVKDFNFSDGRNPEGSLIRAVDGKLYGLTSGGGSNSSGVIFSFDPVTLVYTVVKAFNYWDGDEPEGSLVQANDGKLYGMTMWGGANGDGVIFSFDPSSAAFTKLVDLTYDAGSMPKGNLIQAGNGKLYGMTSRGGSNGGGVIFSFDIATSTYTDLKDLDYNANPEGSLLQATDGNLYGMTSGGGNRYAGIMFSFNPYSLTYKKLKDFGSNYNDQHPRGNLIQGTDKKLYGTTSWGGGNIFSYDLSTAKYKNLKDLGDYEMGHDPQGSLMQASNGKLYGMALGGYNDYGIIFSFDPASQTYSKIKNVACNETGMDVSPLLQADNKVLYGLTSAGGNNSYGVIFSFDPSSSTYEKLRDFDGKNGRNPDGAFTLGSDKKLYGTAKGGSHHAGVIFSFDPSSSAFKKLLDFDTSNGRDPTGSLVEANNGWLYGVTANGGSNDKGVIFSFDPASSSFKKLKDFGSDNADGNNPYGNLAQARDGKLYGLTINGGSNDEGVIFSFDPATSIYKKLLDFDFYGTAVPVGGLVAAKDGKLYFQYGDIAEEKGEQDYSILFSFDPSSSALTRLIYQENSYPGGALVQSENGKLYGSKKIGGGRYYGSIFSFDPLTSNYTTLATFDGADAAYPVGTLVEVSGCIAGTTYYRDADGDGYGNPADTITGCPLPAGYVANNGDCNDSPSEGGVAVHPDAPETCNGVDDDCDGQPDSWILEAEQAVLSGATGASGASGFTGSGYADYQNAAGDYIEWTVNASAPGSFLLQFRYANAGTTDRPLQLKVNGTIITANLSFSPTGAWTTWATSSATIALLTGDNKIRLTTVGSNGPNIDNLAVKIIGCQPGILEAEQAVLNGPVIATSTSGYSGPGYADYINPSGDYIEWTVNSPVTGSYLLQFRYANGALTGRPLQLEVNGIVVASALSFSPTGNWTTWAVSSATADLVAGANKVRLTTEGFNGSNIDYLTVGIFQVSLEAEQAFLNGPIVAYSIPGYSGSGYADYQNSPGDYIEWTVNFPTAANCVLEFRNANGGPTARSLQLEINGSVVDSSLLFPPSGNWTNWGVSGAIGNLVAGTNKIRLTAIGANGPNIDKLTITVASCQPESLEAEKAEINGAAIAAGAPGYTGTGYADYKNTSGDYVEWTINNSEAGPVSLQFRYANGAPTNRPLKLEVDGALVDASLAFSPTGSWTAWSVSSATVHLNAGTYKIRLTSTGFNGPNIDNLTFSCSNSVQPAQQRFALEKKPVLPGMLKAYIYPNPVEGKARLTLSSHSNLPIELKVVDMLGRNYKSLNLTPGRANTFDLPVDNLPPGAYIVVLNQGNLYTHARLVVGGHN